jgi:hypothetical protein
MGCLDAGSTNQEDPANQGRDDGGDGGRDDLRF